VLNVLPQHLCVVVCKSRQRLDAFLLQRLADIDAAGREQSGKHSNAQAHRSAVARKLQAGSFVNSWERALDAYRALCGGAFTWKNKATPHQKWRSVGVFAFTMMLRGLRAFAGLCIRRAAYRSACITAQVAGNCSQSRTAAAHRLFHTPLPCAAARRVPRRERESGSSSVRVSRTSASSRWTAALHYMWGRCS